MATGYTEADRMPSVSDFDYTTSHRPVPIPNASPPTNTSASAAGSQQPNSQSLNFQFEHQPGQAITRDTYEHTERRRQGQGGFSFLRGNSALRNREVAPPLPPAPASRQSPTYAIDGNNDTRDPATNSNTIKHDRGFSFSSRKSSSDGGMFRKSSSVAKQRQQQQEQERLAGQQVPKQAPHLPSLNPLPNISTFGGDDARPDSVAIFNNQYTTDPHPPPLPRQAPPANFSRPGPVAAMPSSSNYNSSSSPAYAIRQGNAFAQAAASSSPSVTAKSTNGEYATADTGNRSESMTNRGRYSYASSTAQTQGNVNSPRRVRRRKDPTPFNALVIGAKNSGKTSFISFLRHSLATHLPKQSSSPSPHDSTQQNPTKSSSSFTSLYQETEMDGERIGVTLWDSAGLEKHIIDLQLREMATFVESKFEETFVEEQKVMRSPGVRDTHIHCVFLVLDPVRLDATIAASAALKNGGGGDGLGNGVVNASGLDDDLDLQVMRALWGKTTVIPVVSKADTLTLGHMAFLKRAVWDSVKDAELDPLEALELEGDEEEEDEDEDSLDEEAEEKEEGEADDDDEDANSEDPTPLPSNKPSKRNGHAHQPSLAAKATTDNNEIPYLPMSTLSPDPYEPAIVGRRYAWGFADPYNPSHSDFTRLRDSIFVEWRTDLRELARTRWYENWRTSRLKKFPGSKQRIRGGVTPVAAVPREGRSPRGFSGQAVPRSVSGGATGGYGNDGTVGVAVGGSPSPPPVAARSIGKAERMMGMSAADAQSVAGTGTYRGVETYQ